MDVKYSESKNSELTVYGVVENILSKTSLTCMEGLNDCGVNGNDDWSKENCSPNEYSNVGDAPEVLSP